jgi:WD40 repeat protein
VLAAFALFYAPYHIVSNRRLAVRRAAAEQKAAAEKAASQARAAAPVSTQTSFTLLGGEEDFIASDDSSLVASLGRGGQIQVLRVPGFERECLLDGARGFARGAAFSRNGTFLATAAPDATVRIWNLKSCEKVATFDPGRRARIPETKRPWALILRLSPDSRIVALTLGESMVWTWNVEGGPSRSLGELPGSVTSMEFSPDSRFLGVGTSSGSVRVFGTEDGIPAASLDEHRGAVFALDFDRDGGQVATGGADQRVLVQPVGVQGAAIELTGHTEAIRRVAFVASGDRLLSASLDGSLRLWSVRDKKSLAKRKADPSSAPFVLSQDRTRILASAEESSEGMEILRAEDLSLLSPRSGMRSQLHRWLALFGPAGDWCGIVYPSGQVHVWRLPAARKD